MAIYGNIITGSSISASAFIGDGSGLTGISAEWDGTLTGNASITGSLFVTSLISGSTLNIGGGDATISAAGAIVGATVSGSGAVTGATLNCDGVATVGGTVSGSAFWDTTLNTSVGNVTGVDSAVNRSLIVANGTTGKAITGSVVTMDPAGNIDAGPTTISANKFSAGGAGIFNAGPLHITGAASFSSTIAVTSSITAATFQATGGDISGSQDLTINRDVMSNRDITAVRDIKATNDLSASNDIQAARDLAINRNASVVGDFTAATVSASSTITAGSFTGGNLNRHYVNELPLSFNSVTTITLGTGSCTDSTNTVYIDHTASVNIVISTSGINGLDTGSEATGTWYAVYVVSGTSGVGGLLSTSETAPTMPSGFTYKRRVGWAYNHSDGDIQNFIQTGMGRERSYTWFETGANYTRVLHNAASSGVRTAVDISSRIPPSAHAYIFAGFPGSASTAAEDQVQVTPLAVSGSGSWLIIRAQNTTIGAGITLTTQEFPVKRDDGQTVGFNYITYFSGDLTANIKGWKETI